MPELRTVILLRHGKRLEYEETEQDRRNRELWESYCELRSLLNGQMNEEE